MEQSVTDERRLTRFGFSRMRADATAPSPPPLPPCVAAAQQPCWRQPAAEAA